ncbi:MAG TPA: class I SAM-dependent methyltransferase [Candidatus Dormibacteraeota bacterium]
MTREPGLRFYTSPEGLPPLVWTAVEAARVAGIDQASRPETGRLLQALAAFPERGRLGELGTAGGVGSAWLVSGMRSGTSLVTVEIDPDRAAVAADVLGDVLGVRALHGDWSDAARFAPFDLLFSDGGPKHDPEAPEQLAPLLRPGGIVVLDDFTPGLSAAEDRTRRIWLETPGFNTVEVQLSPETSVLLAVRTAA